MASSILLPPTAAPVRPPAALSAPASPNDLTIAPDKLAKLKSVAQEFEGVMLNELLAPMFEGLSTDGLGGGGQGEEMFRPMLVDQYAKGMAAHGGIGVADAVLKELVHMQGGQDGAAR